MILRMGLKMTLEQKRIIFTRNIELLLRWIFSTGQQCALDQVKRTQAEAATNAAAGTGIVNSLHVIGLAADILFYDQGGAYLTDSAFYKWAGEYWKGLDPLNCWGGDFQKPDGNHFSMTHNGAR